jgi:hypothetical protein
VAAGLAVLAVGLLVVRGVVIDAVPSAAAPAAGSTFDILVRFLRHGVRVLFVLSLVIAAGACLAGGSDSAIAIRRWSARNVGRIRVGPSETGSVPAWEWMRTTA